MIVIGSSSKPRSLRHRTLVKVQTPEGSGNYITAYMGREHKDPIDPADPATLPGREQIFPMAYLVEQDPDSSLPAHFHISDQYQVFISGDGHLGATPIKDVVVQFSDTYCVYGPIKGGPRGIGYLTLRNRYDPGARHMPHARNELPPLPRHNRQVITPAFVPLSSAALAALHTAQSMALIPMGEGGLCAWRYLLPPGASVTGPDPRLGEGQHWTVIGGSLDCDTELAPLNTCVFVFNDDAAYTAKAGPQGLEILALQYPYRRSISTPFA